MASNSRLADLVALVAKEVEATPAQVALAWVLSNAVPVAAIPGTRRIERLEENFASRALTLKKAHLDRLGAIIKQGVVGERY